MAEKLLLYGSTSYCCNSPSLMVRSREGGFVSQNCTKCGTSRKISFSELPDLQCSRCSRSLVAFINALKNYAYQCPTCQQEWQLSSLIPTWDEHFSYCGLGLESDYVESAPPEYVASQQAAMATSTANTNVNTEVLDRIRQALKSLQASTTSNKPR